MRTVVAIHPKQLHQPPVVVRELASSMHLASRAAHTFASDAATSRCGGCNLRKGSRLPRECHMFPRDYPRQPTTWELQDNGRAFPPNYLHESWRDYLYWDSELES